MIIFQPGNDDI